MTLSIERLEQWLQQHAVDRSGNRIGTITDVYIDDATGTPEWLAINTGLFGTRISFVPLEGAEQIGDQILVSYEKALVKDGPNVEADGSLSEEEEERLYRHYGLAYSRHYGTKDPMNTDPKTELQETGSASMGAEVDPEVAIKRLRKRDADAVAALDLDLKPGDEDEPGS